MLRQIVQLVFSRHGLALLLFTGLVVLFSLVLDHTPRRSVPFPYRFTVVSPRGDLLGTMPGGNRVEVLESKSMQPIAEFHLSMAKNVIPRKFSNDSRYLAVWCTAIKYTGKEHYPLHVWNCRTDRIQQKIASDGGHDSFAFSPDSTQIVVADNYREKSSEEDRYTLGIWNLETGKRLLDLKGHEGLIFCASWSPDGKMIATASTDRTIRLWNASNGLEIKTFQSGSKGEGFEFCEFSSGSRRLIGFGTDKLLIWDVDSGTLISETGFPGLRPSYFHHGESHDVVVRLRFNKWMMVLQEKYKQYLPAWLENWLIANRLRNEMYRLQIETVHVTKQFSLPAMTTPLCVLPDNQGLLAIQHSLNTHESRLEWWDLEPSRPWLKIIAWAAGIAGTFWCLLSLWAWFRLRRQKGNADIHTAASLLATPKSAAL